MLNPSTATADVDDPTIRRCICFSTHWNFGKLIVLNLFTYRSTDPRALAVVPDPVGPENDDYTRRAFARASEVICAWGCQQHLRVPLLRARPAAVVELIPPGIPVSCLGFREDGAPRHPLFVPGVSPRQAFSPSLK